MDILHLFAGMNLMFRLLSLKIMFTCENDIGVFVGQFHTPPQQLFGFQQQDLVGRVEEIRSCVLQIPPTYDPEVSHETLKKRLPERITESIPGFVRGFICHPKTWMPSSIMFTPL